MFRKLTTLLLMVLFVNLCAFAQDKPAETTSEKEKKKKEIDERVIDLLDQAIAGADTLRLAQNRAVVFAMTGDMYWKYDEKKSRELFRNAAAELVAFNLESAKEKRDSQDMYADVFDLNTQARTEILPLVAKRDPELALELLIQTRSAKLTEAILKASLPNAKSGPDMLNFNPDRMRVSNELALEQQFALLAADANPEKAIKMIKDSMSKGISPAVIPLLQKLHKKEPKKAAELGGDVINKLVESDLAKNDEDIRAALSFLQFAFKPATGTDTKGKPFAFTEAQIKKLATAVANALLQPSKTMASAMLLSQAMPMLEKFAPEKIAFLRQRQAENEGSMPSELKKMQERQMLWDANSTAEDIIAQLPKLENEFEKASAYSALSRKISEIEDETRAKKLIDQIPDEKARTNAMEQFEAGRIGRSAKEGKLDEARKMIGNLTKKKTQIQRLVALAIDFQKKGSEKDKEIAVGLMKDARGLTNESPETNDELNDLMEVVRGYATVDPDLAFKMFDPVIDQINEYVQASAVLARFEPQYSSFRKGEIQLKINGQNWDQPLFRYIPQMQALAKANLEKMNALSDRFTRNDSRTIVRLYVIQGILKDEKDEHPAPYYGNNFVIY